MFDGIKNYIEAKLELIKLDFVDRTASVMSKLVGLCVLVSVMIMGVITFLLLLAIVLGYLLNNYILGITIFLGVILGAIIIVFLARKRMIVKPLKNLFIEYLYDEFTKD